MFLSYRYVGGIWKSTMILWAMIVGSIVYYLIFPHTIAIGTVFNERPAALFLSDLTTRWSFEPGVLASFLFCFFALSMNDLGSIQSMKEIITPPPDMPHRINRGIASTGFANAFACFLGIIGPVNFSLSPGVITATRSASRFTLILASIFLFFLSFSPFLIGLLGSIPAAVIGSILIYILCYQIAAGMIVAFQ